MITSRDLESVAAFLMGEGWFGCTSSITVTANQVEREPLDHYQRLFGGKVYVGKKLRISPKSGAILPPQHTWTISGAQAVGLVMAIYPLLHMSPKRQSEIRAALAKWRTRLIAPQYRTHCPSGHEYTPDNIYNKGLYGNGQRRHRLCRACTKQKNDGRSPELKRLYRRRAMAKKPEYYRQAQRDYRERRLASALLEAI